MNGLLGGIGSARSRIAVMAACSVVAALVGGMVLAAPANADTGTTHGCVSMSALGGASTSGLVDVSGLTSNQPSLDVLGCTIDLADGSSSTVGVAPVSPVTTPTSDPTTTTAPGTSGTDLSPISTSAASAASSKLADLSLVQSSDAVYPVTDGYLDSVRFAIRAMNSVGDAVAAVGSAVLSKAGKPVETWQLDGSKSVIEWNGRVDRRIETGLFTLKATAWSRDGSEQTADTVVRVLDKHLVEKHLVVTKDVHAETLTDEVPRELLKAYSVGRVSVRTRTDAVVHGTAHLVFTGLGGTHTIPLLDGLHTTKASVVPQGFAHVTVTLDRVKGAAHLRSMTSIWTYRELV